MAPSQGFETVEYTICALLDQALHALPKEEVARLDLEAFEAQQLELDARIEERRKQELKEASGRDLLQACLNNDSSDSDDEVEEAD